MLFKKECGTVIIADRARRNRSYIRILLERNNPEFAVVLEDAVRELAAVATGPVCQRP